MVVAIDGPAGAGKSTVARAAARALGFTYLDSGAMYRAVGLQTLRLGGAASEHAEALDIELGERVLVGGEDVTAAIRAPEVSEAASKVATNPAVRRALAGKQRELLASGDWVAEGRDIGTVVVPDAAVKVFLTASAQERARRRAVELGTDTETVLRDQALRDAQDTSREHSPLALAPGAVELDTGGRDIDAVVARIVELVEAAGEPEAPGSAGCAREGEPEAPGSAGCARDGEPEAPGSAGCAREGEPEAPGSAGCARE